MATKTKKSNKSFTINQEALDKQLSTTCAYNWVIQEALKRVESGKELGPVTKCFFEQIGIGDYK